MSTKVDQFIEVGMKKFKQASVVMLTFQETMESRLQSILMERKGDLWDKYFSSGKCSSKTTRTWNKYPSANATMLGEEDVSTCTVGVAVDWFDADNEYCAYRVWLDPRDKFQDQMNSFEWSERTYMSRWGLCFNPNENDFNLERDFEILLDEIVRFLESSSGGHAVGQNCDCE